MDNKLNNGPDNAELRRNGYVYSVWLQPCNDVIVNKKAPVKDEGNLMFSQRNNPYCDLLAVQR
jgi:hypothetical protein